MVSGLLVIALLVVAVLGWAGQAHQFCLSCHPTHYTERGRCSDCHRGNQLSERKNIAHVGLRAGKYVRYTINDTFQTKEMEPLMDLLACRRCHVNAGRGNGLAMSLDGAAIRKKADELAMSIRRPVANMPNFYLDEEQITTLVNAVFAGSQRCQTGETAPLRIHFNAAGKKNADVFSTKCGSCHRILSQRLGAIGSGNIAPNLSGLFTEFYPKTFRNGEAWTVRSLSEWLKNPRDTRRWSRMIPVALTESESQELASLLQVSSALK